MRQRQVSSSLSHDQGSPQSPSHARRYAETSDVHFVSIPPGTAPGEWFRVLLPGYEPPRWLDMQMQEGYSEEARLEVTVPKLGPSVYATRARRALPARVFRTCLTPTFAVAFIWSLVLANWAVVVCNYACRSFRPDVEGSPGQLSLGIVLLGHAILLLQIVSFWQLQATHPGAPPLVFGGGPGCSRVCARSGLQQPERAMWATNVRGWLRGTTTSGHRVSEGCPRGVRGVPAWPAAGGEARRRSEKPTKPGCPASFDSRVAHRCSKRRRDASSGFTTNRFIARKAGSPGGG